MPKSKTMNAGARGIVGEVDAARARASRKRGGGLQRVEETAAWTLDSVAATGTSGPGFTSPM